MNSLRRLFLLDPEVVYLNHGSFGATPQPVFDEYQRWQRRLERQPVRFMEEVLRPELGAARHTLAAYLGAGASDLVLVPNATFGVNAVARSLPLEPGDEVLTTNHEYGAIDNVLEYTCRERGASLVRQAVALPVRSPDHIADTLWRAVTPRTRVICISHITSPTALRLPVEQICARAREAGIMTLIDGAHAPGQIPLELTTMGADFYTGNCHKWLCSPKGAGFLYSAPARQVLLEPLVVGWGWGERRKRSSGSDFLDYFEWLGTNDLSAYLSVPAAIAFQQQHDWPRVRSRCHALLTEALQRIADLTGEPSPYPEDHELFHQMAIAPLPAVPDPTALRERLYRRHRIEIPVVQWQDRIFLRISVQGYNTAQDIDALLEALRMELE